MRIALGLEYDGSRFCGWQSQPCGCGVQDALEAALSRIAGQTLRVTAAGRTDSGVHAQAQVIHFDTDAQRPLTAWVRGVNALLPDGIAVLWARQVGETFHARYSALERCYRYLLLNRPVHPGLYRHQVGWFHLPLDLEAMRQAAAPLLGSHDFSAFRSAECQAHSPVRTLTKIELSRYGDLIVFEFWANAFLHRMVRNIVGCLVYVGKGRYPPQWLAEVLASRNRTQAAPTFPPEGLYLAAVRYDRTWGLPEPSGTGGPALARLLFDSHD